MFSGNSAGGQIAASMLCTDACQSAKASPSLGVLYAPVLDLLLQVKDKPRYKVSSAEDLENLKKWCPKINLKASLSPMMVATGDGIICYFFNV